MALDDLILKERVPFAQYQIVDVTFGEAHVDTDIRHSLQPPTPEHIDYTILRQAQAATVYHDMSGSRKAWGQGVIRLRSNVANARVTLLLTVSHDKRSLITSGPTSIVAPAPSHTHDAEDTVSGTFAVARIPDLDAAKITSGTFATARIPDLDAGKITTGSFATARIPNLDAAKITTGSFAKSFLPTSVAYEDEANVFTQNQTISLARPYLILDRAGAFKARFYEHTDGRAAVTANLSYDGSNWNRDDTTSAVALIGAHPSVPLFAEYAASGANPVAALSRIFEITTTGQVKERGRSTPIGEWEAYTPTITNAGGGFSMGNGSVTGRVMRVGKTVFYTIYFTIGSTTNLGATSSPLYYSLPSTATFDMGGFCRAVNTAWYMLAVLSYSAGYVAVVSGAGWMTPTNPGTFGSGHTIYLWGSYEE